MNQNQIFTKLVKRFPKDDLHNVVENWSPLNHPGLGSQQKNLLLQEAVGRTGKRKFISAVLKHFTVITTIFLKLDFSCFTFHAARGRP